MARRDFKPAHLRAALRHVAAHTRACPCHACLPRRVLRIGQPLPLSTTAAAAPPRPSPNASALASTDYAFEMATSSIRYGRGVTAEVGHDLRALGATRVAIFTDAGVLRTAAFSTALASIDAAGVSRAVFSDVRVEPTDASFSAAAAWARAGGFDAYVAVGGGSTIDTAKAANLYATHSSHEFLDFVNMPIGRGMPVPGPVRPLIAIPTTAGTGSETTGVAIFDHEPTRAKTGIGSRHLRPVLGLIDPANMDSMPREVAVASGARATVAGGKQGRAGEDAVVAIASRGLARRHAPRGPTPHTRTRSGRRWRRNASTGTAAPRCAALPAARVPRRRQGSTSSATQSSRTRPSRSPSARRARTVRSSVRRTRAQTQSLTCGRSRPCA